MKTAISKAVYFLFLSIVLSAGVARSQQTVNFDVDVSLSNYRLIKTLVLPGNKTAVLIGTQNYSNIYLYVYNSSGTRITTTDISSLIPWPSSERLSTEFNAIVTNSGNIFITITSSDSDLKLTDNASFIIINETGDFQDIGQVNTTDPGNSLTRFIQMSILSDGRIVIQFQRTDNSTYAFRIFYENGIAYSPNDVVYAGPGTSNNLGTESVMGSRIAAFKNGNFLVSYYFWDDSFRGILFDNNGNTLSVDGFDSFEIDNTIESEYNINGMVPLSNNNMVISWRMGSSSYFKILNNVGSTIQTRQSIDGGRYLGNFIPNNTVGSEGFIATEYTLQDPDDYFGNPYVEYTIKKYNQIGELQSTTPVEGYLIQPSYQFASRPAGGFVYVYSYYKSFSLADGEYTITSDNDLKGVMTDFNMSTLPVNLISFTITLTANQKAQLDWSTSSETNNKKFEIERSTDGMNFSLTGSVNASNNSTVTTNYSFTDPESVSTITWYRLKQIDLDGKVKILGIKLVNPGTIRKSASINPNPVAGNTVNVSTGDEILPAIYQISDVQGRIVKKGTLLQSNQQLDVRALNEGIYFLKIGKNVVLKFKK